MKKIIKPSVISFLIILVIIQFIRPPKNLLTSPGPNDITSQYPTPDTVMKILQVACFDCHSNNTRYPWYSRIQPVYWWLNSHINDGKEALNFSEFMEYPVRRQYKRLQGIIHEVKEGSMPLTSYVWIHHDAKLNNTQKSMLINWVTAIQTSIKLKYPSDSLKNLRPD